MARPSKYNWEEIKHAYECGKDVDELVSKYGITKKTLQNKISQQLWEVTGSIKADIASVKDSLGKVTGTIALNPQKAHIIAEDVLGYINELADKLDAKKLINGATMMNLTRTIELLQSNTKLEKINVGDGMQNFESVGLGSNDYKSLQETIDKASITLGVNERFSQSAVINNTNAQQTVNKIEIVVE